MGGALVVIHAGGGVGPGGGVRRGGPCFGSVLAWGGWPAFEGSVGGGSGDAVLWWC